MPDATDPFAEARTRRGVEHVDCEGQDIPLLLRLEDVRNAARDWKTFSNDIPLLITLHTEANVRSTRQLPIETDPPEHSEYRSLIEPLFRRPLKEEFQAQTRALVDQMVAAVVNGQEMDAVRQFALPLQSRTLAQLLGMPDAEAQVWIGWGIHVFHDGGNGEKKGAALVDYIAAQLHQAEQTPGGQDMFSILNGLEFRGRKLSEEEKVGFAMLAFAGGRDTVINTVSSIIAYLADHPEAFDFLREDPARLASAAEEFVRYVSPLTALARGCPHGAAVGDAHVAPGDRIGLCWSSANRDESVFPNADQVILDRSPNPHVGYGFGKHHCLGAHHARLVIRSLLRSFCDRLTRIELLEAVPRMEHESSYSRQVGYDLLRVRFH
jgi:cytochrome P450